MRLFINLVLLALAVGLGVFLYYNPSEVELSYQTWVLQMPLWVPVAGLIAFFLVLSIVTGFFKIFVKIYVGLRDWLFGSSARATLKNANLAAIAFAEGDWLHAEQGMLKTAKHSEFPLRYYLSAAIAAQRQGAIDRRDRHLRAASKAAPNARVAIGLCTAELQLQQEQYDFSLVTLLELRKVAPNNRKLLDLLAQLYQKRREWQELQNLLPNLKKYLVYSQAEQEALELKVFSKILEAQSANADSDELQNIWETFPKNMRHHPELIYQYVCCLLLKAGADAAETVLRNALKKQWHDKLVMLYGLAIGQDLRKQLATAESWLVHHKTNPALLLCLARLCVASKLWGKARAYLDACLAIEKSPEAYAELGRLLGILGEQQKSLDCYREGLLEFATVLEIEGLPAS